MFRHAVQGFAFVVAYLLCFSWPSDPASADCGGGPQTRCTCSGDVACWPGNATRPEDFTTCHYDSVPSNSDCPTLRAMLESSCAASARAKSTGPVKIVCSQQLTCAAP